MKWMTESKAYVYVYPDIIHPNNMMVHVDCDINEIPYSWGNYISNYICHKCKTMFKIPLQDYLIQAGLAYEKTKNGQ